MKGGTEGAESVGGPEKLEVPERAGGSATLEGAEAGKIAFYPPYAQIAKIQTGSSNEQKEKDKH